MAATFSTIPNPKVGVPHKLQINLDGDTISSIQWFTTLTPGGSSSNISGATSAVYTPTANLAGRYLGCEIEFLSAGTIEWTTKPEDKILAHTAASTGPRFRITRSSNAPRAKTSFEVARESGQS